MLFHFRTFFCTVVFGICVLCVFYISECPFVRDKSTNLDNQAHGILCFSHLVGDERFSLGPALHKFKQR